MLVRGVDGREAVTRFTEHILDVLGRPFLLEGSALAVQASLGIALYPEHGQSVDVVLQRADVAMYVAKAARAGRELYAAERDGNSRARLTLGSELRKAIDERQLEVYYQPKVDLRTGATRGVEAVVR